MKEWQSQSHVRWYCRYHGVIVPKYRKKAIYGVLRKEMGGVRAHILVIDDDEFIRSLFKETLEEQGHTVLTTDNAAKGLAYVMQHDFDLIFLDLKMSGTDGAEILRKLKSVSRKLPVVIITGYPDGEIMERAMKQGPIGVMLKPFDNSDIVGAADSFLRATRSKKRE